MKIVEWNINLRTQKATKYKNSIEADELMIPKFVSDVLNDIDSDIIVLTEFVQCNNWKEFVGNLKSYNVYTNCDNEKKGVLVAIKKEIEIIEVIKDLNISDNNNCIPHFLQVTVKYMNKEISIIGTRIKVLKGDKTDFRQRKEQFDCLKEHICTISNASIIVTGDFNNARILKDYTGKNQETYNYEKIKKWFEDIGLTLIEIEGFSHMGYLKEDHIILSHDMDATCEYSDSFISEKYLGKEIYYNIYFKGDYYKKNDISLPIGYPDHNLLKAIITFKL